MFECLDESGEVEELSVITVEVDSVEILKSTVEAEEVDAVALTTTMKFDFS